MRRLDTNHITGGTLGSVSGEEKQRSPQSLQRVHPSLDKRFGAHSAKQKVAMFFLLLVLYQVCIYLQCCSGADLVEFWARNAAKLEMSFCVDPATPIRHLNNTLAQIHKRTRPELGCCRNV